MEWELKSTKSKLNHSVSKLATKAGNLELKMDMQFEFQAKLSRMTRKLPKLKYELALQVIAYPWILSKYYSVRSSVSFVPLQIIVGAVFRLIICSFVCETA